MEQKYIKTRLLSIDAWRDDCGWQWNNWFEIEDGIYFDSWETLTSARQLFAFMRRNGWLTDASKGRVSLENDEYNIVIMDKNTREPILAFEYGCYIEG